MPAGLAALKPGLIPACFLVAEVPDLRIAACAVAGFPFIGPVLSRPAYPGPQWQPLIAIYARDGIYTAMAGEYIVLITPTGGWLWINGLAALMAISAGYTMNI